MNKKMVSKEEIEKLREKVERLRDSGNERALISAIEELVSAYLQSNTILEVIPYSLELKDYYQKTGDQTALARNYDFLGRIHTYIPDFDKAEEYSRIALSIYSELEDHEGMFYSNGNLGWIYRQRGKPETALEHLLTAEKHMRKHLDKTGSKAKEVFLHRIPNLLDQIGLLYGNLHQNEKARKYLRSALEKAKEYNDPETVYKELINLGVSYSEEDTDKTLKYYLEALPLVKAHGKKNTLAIVKNNIGGVYEDKGELDKALSYYQKALAIVNESGFPRYRMFYLKHIGTVYFKKREYEKALEYVNRSLHDAEKNESSNEIEENLLLLSNIHKEMKNWKQSLELFERYSEIKDKRLNAEVLKKLTQLQEKYEETKSKLVKTERKESLITKTLKSKINMNFIGNSKAIKEVLNMAMTAAEHKDTNVLITGESGTGKEIIAHIIHFASERKENLLIPVNCSSIPSSLVESEFFGFNKGAFTGAESSKTGYFVNAHNGTLFLDEIGDMPLSLQAKMLRVLENKQVKPLGSNSYINVDFRLIAATNKDVSLLVKNNTFRIDLFYRINTIEINIPPLRERKADIEPLLYYYISFYAKILNKPIPKVSGDLIEELKAYQFPGNVRELKNMVERAIIVNSSNVLSPDDFRFSNTKKEEAEPELFEYSTLEEMEIVMINQALKLTGNNHTHTARRLGISYSTLLRKLKRYNIV